MIQQLFGDYLVKTGRLSAEQLQTVFESQKKVRVKLGLIAVSEGMLTLDQADAINRLQQTMDKRFGDIAVEKGYLTDAQVLSEDKLFATLDTTVRKVIIENLPFLLSDTVGFIRKLPTDLVESFKSTLDEVREADLLLHVVDVSHPEFEEQIAVVEKTLADLNCGDKPIMVIFNKIDAFTYVQKDEDDLTPKTRENITLDELKETWMNKLAENCLFISAREKQNIDNLKDIIYKRVCELHVQKYPYNDFLYQTYEETEE